MRSAISPRLAIRTLVNTASPEPEQGLARLDLVAGVHEESCNGAIALGLDGVEDLHGFDDA